MPRKDSILKIRLPESLKLEAERLADEKGETVAFIVREALRQYLDQHPWKTSTRVTLLPSPEPPAKVAEDPTPYETPPPCAPECSGGHPHGEPCEL